MFLHLCFFSATHSPSFFHRVPPLRYRTPLAHREHNGPGSCTQLLDGASNTRPAPPSPSIQSLRCNWHSEVQWDEAATGPSPYCALLPPLPPPPLWPPDSFTGFSWEPFLRKCPAHKLSSQSCFCRPQPKAKSNPAHFKDEALGREERGSEPPACARAGKQVLTWYMNRPAVCLAQTPSADTPVTLHRLSRSCVSAVSSNIWLGPRTWVLLLGSSTKQLCDVREMTSSL